MRTEQDKQQVRIPPCKSRHGQTCLRRQQHAALKALQVHQQFRSCTRFIDCLAQLTADTGCAKDASQGATLGGSLDEPYIT